MSGILLVAGIPNDTGEAGPHAYFDSLVARADHWLSYSLRDDEQLLTYRHSGSLPADVVYDASMDAAKATVREYLRQAHAELSADCDDTATTLSLTILISAGVFDTANRFLQIGDEVLQLDAVTPHPTQTTINVSRGQRGTTAAAHTAGDDVHVGSQSLENQERFPLGTSDGHRYFFTWDSYWDDGCRAPRSGLEAYKMTQFESKLNTSLDLFTSSGHTREAGLDLVSWWRNFVALVDPPADVTALLQRPV